MAASPKDVTQQLTDYFADVGIYKYRLKQSADMLMLVNNALALLDYYVTDSLHTAWESHSRRQSFTLNYSDTSGFFDIPDSDDAPETPEIPKKPARPYGMISEREVKELMAEAEAFLKRFGMSLYSTELNASFFVDTDTGCDFSFDSEHVAQSFFKPQRQYGQISPREVMEVYTDGMKFIERYERAKARKTLQEAADAADAADMDKTLYPVNELSFDAGFNLALDESRNENTAPENSLELSDISFLDSSLPLSDSFSTPVATRVIPRLPESKELMALQEGEKNHNGYDAGTAFRNFWWSINFTKRFALTAERTMRGLAQDVIESRPSREEFASLMTSLRAKFNVAVPEAPQEASLLDETITPSL